MPGRLSDRLRVGLLARVRATVVSQTGQPPLGMVRHQVGDLGEPAAVRRVQLPREPFRLVVAPELGNELEQDPSFTQSLASFKTWFPTPLPASFPAFAFLGRMLSSMFMTASVPQTAVERSHVA